MENISIAASERSPEIDFNFETNTFSLRGESYPEDVNAFFGPLIGNLESHLDALNEAKVEFTFELIYFNSSTAKVLMNLFDALDRAAENGNEVLINWVFEADDDNMEEMGEEFGEDLEHAKFQLRKMEA